LILKLILKLNLKLLSKTKLKTSTLKLNFLPNRETLGYMHMV